MSSPESPNRLASPNAIDKQTNAQTLTFHVGKLDAGIAILMSRDYQLVEVPASLLPNLSPGVIINMTIQRDLSGEEASKQEFTRLQDDIWTRYQNAPLPPKISLKTATQTSMTISWEPLQLFKCDLLGLDVYKNGVKVSSAHLYENSAKLTGLNISTEYQVQLGIRTTGGSFMSNLLTCKTHALEDLSGVAAAVGELGETKLDHVQQVLKKLGAKYVDQVGPDTTHLISMVPSGEAYKKATELNIPVVNVDWLEKCLAQMRIQAVGPYTVFAPVTTSSEKNDKVTNK